MSTYHKFSYDQDMPVRLRSAPPIWVIPILIGFFVGIVGGPVLLLGLWWHFHDRDVFVSVQPRAVTARGELDTDENATIVVFKAAAPSVVHVTNLAVQRSPYSPNGETVATGSGTGFIWDDNGFIVTNHHVVDGASKARVVLADHSTYDSSQIWSFPDKDLAVIRIDAPKWKLKPIVIGSSHDLQVGQKTIAIGNPFGLDQTLTTGVVSALDREIEAKNGKAMPGMIQTSAAINPGNSGGPLLDSAGRLIGVNTAIVSPSGTFAGIGFAIPVDEVNRVVPQLIDYGSKKNGSTWAT